MEIKEFTISVDFAKKSDYTGIQIYKKVPVLIKGSKLLKQKDLIFCKFDLVFQDKFQNLKYTEIAEKIKSISLIDWMIGKNDIIVDGTGVGEVVVDLMREIGLKPYPLVYTAGNSVREVYAKMNDVFGGGNNDMKVLKQINVSKVNLVDAGRIAMENGIIRVAPNIKYREDFKKQLAGFKGKLKEGKKAISYEAESESLHDDLVACFLQASWWFHYNKPKTDEIEEDDMDEYFSSQTTVNFNLFDD